MAQLEYIEAIEKRLWSAADTMRANSSYASNEYFLPVMGLIFLRHAYSRFLAVKGDIESKLPSRGGKVRPLTKEDFSQHSSIFLQPKAQFDSLVALPDSEDRAQAIIEAMESIEADYESLRGVLPKTEYQELDNKLLGDLLRTLNPEELKRVKGDVFGRIYEYFLTRFADVKAHDGGEFFTPISLVSLIAHILEPDCGTVLDPACGSGGMFVQSARIVEQQRQNPNEKLTFKGLEKNATTIRLAKMNLAVHGLEGNIQQAISYYEDPHNLVGKASYVMANPPFNVDEIDAEKVKKDERLPFGLPGVNKAKKVSNGNYIWISYFYSYLNEKGRAGFVMSSQASSAGRDEAAVRQKLVETGDVDAMIAIRSNFFYTRTVPCELWFFDRAKPEAHKDKVLMIDARNIYHKVTRKIYDFSPEQEQNILAIMWLYRGELDRYHTLVTSYGQRMLDEATDCATKLEDQDATIGSRSGELEIFEQALNAVYDAISPFMATLESTDTHAEALSEYENAQAVFISSVLALSDELAEQSASWSEEKSSNAALVEVIHGLSALVDRSKSCIRYVDAMYKKMCLLIDVLEKHETCRKNSLWVSRDITRARKAADTARHDAVEQLKKVQYFHKQALWLTARFPDGVLCDVEGLVKLVSRDELAANDWSLTPGRYVGVAPEEADEDFNFEEALRDIHMELESLNEEAVQLAATIKKNFEGLGL